MSSTVDNRVVQMQFDNRQFESGVKDTMSTLEKLDSKLHLSGAAQGIVTVSSKFSALGVMVKRTLENITDMAFNAGKRIVKSLTTDPIMQGFNEYELKMGSVQTIMASTGESLETVNKHLEELNEYSDKTIYSFSDMTSNIGKFTNAGVKLKDAVTAIKGISNVAALSGANANEASRAMYNFSQALSAGYVKLIDWKSIENANMATVGFKDELLKTAIALGTVTDAGDGMYKTLKGNTFNATKNFNEVLQDQWMTTDVLVQTLARYTDETTELGKKAYSAAQDIKTFSMLMSTLKEAAQSGWAQTWEIIVGDFEEAKVFLGEINQIIGGILGEQADARNNLLKGWKELGGRTALIDSLRNAFDALMSVVKPIKEALRDIFPPITSEQLFKLTEGLKNFTANLKMSDSAADKLKRTAKGIFAVLDIAVEIIKGVAGGIWDVVSSITPAGDGLLGFSAAIGDLLVAIRDFIKKNGIIIKTCKTLAAVIGTVVDALLTVATATMSFSLKGFDAFSKRLIKRFGPLAKVLEGLIALATSVANVFKRVFNAVWPVIAAVGNKIADAVGSMLNKFATSIENAEFSAIFDTINAVLSTGILASFMLLIRKFGKLTDSATGIFKNFGKIGEGINNILDGVRGCLEAYQSSIKANTLKTIATAIAILAASILVLSLIDSARLTAALGAITAMFIELFGSMAIFNKVVGDKKIGGLTKLAVMMVGISVSIFILAGAMAVISRLGWEDIAKGLTAVTVLIGLMIGTAALLSKTKTTDDLLTAAAGLIIFSIALRAMVKPVRELGSLDAGAIVKGLAGIAGLMAEMILFTKLAGKPSDIVSTAASLVLIGTALLIFSKVVKTLGAMRWEELGKGLLATAAALGAIVLAMKLMPENMASAGVGLLIVSTALVILASALKIMGNQSWEDVAKGLLSLTISLFAIAGALAIMKSAIPGALAMLIIAPALILLAAALKIIGSMSWGEVAKSLVGLAGGLLVITGALYLLGVGAQYVLLGVAAILAVAPAILVLAVALKVLGSITWEGVAIGMVALAGVFLLFGAAAAVLSYVMGPMLGLSVAVALLGAGCLAASVGILALSVALPVLAAVGLAGATVLVEIVTMIVDLIPYVAQKIGEGIMLMIQMFIDNASAIRDAAITFIMVVIDAISVAIPRIVETIREAAPLIIKTIGEILAALIDFMFGYYSHIVMAGVKFIKGILEGIANNIGDIVHAAVDLVTNFIEALGIEYPRIIQAGFDFIINFVNGLAEAIRGNTQPLVDACDNLGSAIIEGVVTGIGSHLGNIWDAVVELGTTALNGIKDLLGIHSPSTEFQNVGLNCVLGLIDGIKNMAGSAWSTISNLGANALTAIKDKTSGFLSAGKSFVSNLVSGIRSNVASAFDAASTLASQAVSAITSKVSSFKSAASNVISGFVNGLMSGISNVAKTASNVAKYALNSIKNVLGIHSPSTELEEVGMYSDEGLAGGLKKFAGLVTDSGSDVGEAAVESIKDPMSSISDLVGDNLDSSPVISPILDLTNVESGAAGISSLFSNDQAVAVNTELSGRTNSTTANGDGSTAVPAGSTYSFVQNNYSPKSLSKVEIYRQTKNLFSIQERTAKT